MGKRSMRQVAAAPGKGPAKRQKQEGITWKSHKSAHKQRPVHLSDPELEGSEDEDAVDEEDLDFVRCLGAPAAAFLSAMDAIDDAKPGQLPSESAVRQQQQWQQDQDSDADEAEEAVYRRQMRSRLVEQEQDLVQRLPIKGLDGSLTYESKLAARTRIPESVTQVAGVTIEEGPPDEEVTDGKAGEQADMQQVDSQSGSAWNDATDPQPPSDGDKPEIESFSDSDESNLQAYQNAEERREELKQQMAVACKQLLQAPEDHLRNLRAMLALTVDADTGVIQAYFCYSCGHAVADADTLCELIVRMALLSLMAVFKDILPGYRIRLPTEKERALPVSKDVKRTRDFEAGLLRLYQAFVKQLTAAVANAAEGNAWSSQLSQVALHCMHGLLAARPHFNCSSELLQVVVPTMTHRDKCIASSSCSAVQQILTNDQQGNIMLEVVQLVADLVKKHNCRCDSQVLTCLFSMDIREAEMPTFDKKKGGKAQKRKKAKQNGVLSDVQNTFREADAEADAKTAKQQQSLVLEALFEMFFRVMKHAAGAIGLQGAATTAGDGQLSGCAGSGSRSRRASPLLGAALEGVRRFGHHISIEYFQDLAALLVRLLGSGRLHMPLRLQCLLTGTHISRLQQDALTDQHGFLDELCTLLDDVPIGALIQGGAGVHEDGIAFARASAMADQQAETPVLLARIAQDMLCGPSRMLDVKRLSTAIKQLGLTALAVDSGTALGLLAVAARVLHRHTKLYAMLEHESGTPAAVTSHSGLQLLFTTSASASVAWELALLARHYHPIVAQRAQSAARRTSSGADVAGNAAGISAAYSVAEGAFKPVPQQPAARSVKAASAAMRRAVQPAGADFRQVTEAAEASGDEEALRHALLLYFRAPSADGYATAVLKRRLSLLHLQLAEFKQPP